MTDKRAFEALLDEYIRIERRFTPTGLYSEAQSRERQEARAAVLAAYQAARVRDADPNEPDDPPLPEFAAAGREGQPVRFASCACEKKDGVYWNEFNGVVQCHRCWEVYTVAHIHPAPKADAAADLVCVPRSVALSAAAEIEQMMDQEGCAPALRPMRAVLRNKLREAAADWLCVPRELMERVDFVLACAGLASIQDGERTFNDVHAMLAASPARGGDDRDAARYRWLRQREVHINTRLFCRPGRSESLDKQIDAAMSREAQG